MHTELKAPPPIDISDLFRQHAARVERTLLRLGVRPSDVADATQEVFVVAHRKLPEFEGRASASTWLYRIALRVAAAQRRLARHRREVASEELTRTAVAELDVQAELERRALLEHVAAALERLSESQRDVLALHELEGLRMREVAARLRIPCKTAFSRVYAARRALAAELRRRGYAVPALWPIWPGSALPSLSRPTASARAGSMITSAIAPVWLALCVGLSIQGPQPPRPAPAPLKVSPVLALSVASAPSPAHAGRAPDVSPPSAAKPQRAPVRRRAAAAPSLSAPVRVEAPAPAAFSVTHMSSDEPRPLLEHPLARRLRDSVWVHEPVVVPTLTSARRLRLTAGKLVPAALDADVPVSFD